MKKQTEMILLKILMYIWLCVMCFTTINAALSFIFLDIKQSFAILTLLVIFEFAIQLQLNIAILEKLEKLK